MARGPVDDRGQGTSTDEGFSLIEVIVSLSLLAIMSTAGLYFFVGATRSVTHQQRTHGAVSLANDAMEKAFSFVAESANPGTSGLVVGRTQADVVAAWTAATASGVAGVSTAYPAWDTSTTPGPAAGFLDDRIALTRTATESRTEYQVTTLVGTCYRASTTTGGPCTTTGGDANGVAAAGYTRLMRTIVVVTWPDTGGTCGSTGCHYEIASLIDPSADVEWNNTTRLLAVDDSVAVDAPASAAAPPKVVVIDVLDNDTLMQISSNPVTLVSAPVKASTGAAMGSATVNSSTGRVEYTVPWNASGEVTFTYRVTVGARSAQAVVHVYVTPQAQPIAASGVVGSTITIPVTTVLGGTPTEIDVVSPPSVGTVTESGTSFRYVGSLAGVYTFTYTYKDPDGMTSLSGQVTVTVATYATPVAGDKVREISSSATPTQETLDVRTMAPAPNNPVGYKTQVLSVPAVGTLRVGPTVVVPPTATTSALSYTPPARWAGTASFTYEMLAPDDSSASAVGTVQVRVKPVATADPGLRVARNTKGAKLSVRANDVTTSGVLVQPVSASGTSGCKLSTDQKTGAADGDIYVDVPDRSSFTCTYTYKLVADDGSSPALESAVVTVTVTRA